MKDENKQSSLVHTWQHQPSLIRFQTDIQIRCFTYFKLIKHRRSSVHPKILIPKFRQNGSPYLVVRPYTDLTGRMGMVCSGRSSCTCLESPQLQRFLMHL